MGLEYHYKLKMIAADLLMNGGGILTVDESPSSFGKKISIDNTLENRRLFRSTLFTASNIRESIRGVILHEEMFIDSLIELLKEHEIYIGIKMDLGLKEVDGGFHTVGIETLEERLKDNKFLKADFVKWRSLFKISESTPTERNIIDTCEQLSLYASLCQKYGKVPVIEPEILWDGTYTLQKAIEVSKKIYSRLFYQLNKDEVIIQGLLLKIGFVSSGKEGEICSLHDLALATIDVCASSVPAGVPGILFLSGGRSEEESMALLREIKKLGSNFSGKFSFSFGRALTNSALGIFDPEDLDTIKIHEVFGQSLKEIKKAMEGEE